MALWLAALWQTSATVAAQPDPTPEERYASPLEMLVSPDGQQLYVLCQGADEVRVLDAASGRVLRDHPGGACAAGLFSVAGWAGGCS